MGRPWGLLFVAFYSFSTPAADSCAPIDHRAALGPARNQDPTGWCFAYSAAELVTQKLGVRVSAFDLATAYLLGDEQAVLASDDPRVRDYLRSHPDFLRNLIRWRADEPASYQASVILTENGLMNLGGMDDDAILLAGNVGYCRLDRLPEGEAAMKRHLRDIRRAHARRDLGRDGARVGPIGVITEPESRIAAHVFREWVDARCGPRLRPRERLIPGSLYMAADSKEYEAAIAAGRIDRDLAQSELLRTIDRQLDAGRAVAIGFDAYEIYDRDQADLDEGDHSSVIAARRPVNGVCHYNLRVHYGRGCDFKRRLRGRCERRDGSLWVTREELRTMYAAVWIQ